MRSGPTRHAEAEAPGPPTRAASDSERHADYCFDNSPLKVRVLNRSSQYCAFA